MFSHACYCVCWQTKLTALWGAPPPPPAGDTIYNLSRVTDLETDDDTDRPAHPPVLTRAEVLWNPFEDLVPRVDRWAPSRV